MQYFTNEVLVVLYNFMNHLCKTYGIEKAVPYAYKQWNLYVTGERGAELGDDAIYLIDRLGYKFQDERLVLNPNTDWTVHYCAICDQMVERNLG